MTYREKAESLGITVAELRAEMAEYAQCEGYDDDGREYATLDAWLRRGRCRVRHEPVDAFDVPGAE